jgi:phosphate transport system protein
MMNQLKFGQHISRPFNEELEAVRSKVLEMGGIVEQQFNDAVHALISGNPDMARLVVANDARVNSLEVEIDEECTQIVANGLPAATDLRLVMSIIKTINDLERIGDEAKRVGRMVQNKLDGALEEEIRQELEHMGELVRSMLRQALDAFARTDVKSAIKVHRADRKVDIKYKTITRQLMTFMAADTRSIPTLLNVLWAARAMERMGDRCQNIAEYVIYLVHGKDVRHTRSKDLKAEIKTGTRTG